MGKILIGAVVGAIAMFVLGFIFFATPLSSFGHGDLPNAQAAEVQGALARNLPETGTYFVPSDATPEQTVMYGQGPIATIHYNTDGFASFDPASMLVGFLLYLLVAFFIAGGLWAVERQVRDFGSRAKVVVAFAVAAAAYIHLRMPIFYHHDLPHAIYYFIADAVTLGVGGLIIARWFLPRSHAAPADAPRDV